MSFMNKVDNFMEWMHEGSDAIALMKFLTVTTTAVAVMVSPLIYIGYQNAHALEQRFEQIDSGVSEVFNSVAECQAKYNLEDCNASKEEALDIARELGTTIEYSSQSACSINHTQCDSHTFMVPITNRVGNTSITTYVSQTHYVPAVVGWQAMVDDLTIAVPLYQADAEGMAVRKDGHRIEMHVQDSAQTTQISQARPAKNSGLKL